MKQPTGEAKTPKAKAEAKTPKAKASFVSVDGVDLTNHVTIEAANASSVQLVSVDPAGDTALAAAASDLTNAAETEIVAGDWNGHGLSYRNQSRTEDGRLRVSFGVRTVS